jgi:signal transduction histidine kinase/DNA-binding LacI/PurR family transcriptional regulator/DNA-binding response OmpR family regulator
LVENKKEGLVRKGNIPTIGYLGASMIIEQPLQAGLIDAARSANINLIIFSGGGLQSPHGFDSQRTRIFELAGEENVEGLIIGSDFLGHYVGAEKIKEFCQQYRPLPIVKFEPLVEGYPTLIFNFYQGMYDLIAHLVDIHGFTKIGYITGPDQSRTIRDRYRAYLDVLIEKGIPFREDLIVRGTITSSSGDEAVRIFLEERCLRPGIDLEAIVCFYDLIAVDTLTALQERGIRVPQDIAIAGFDDDEAAFGVNPRITTVRLPFYEFGRWGVETLVNTLHGEIPPEVTCMAASLVIRQSCGCKPYGGMLDLSISGEDDPRLPMDVLTARRSDILLLMTQVAGIQNIPSFQVEIEKLLDAFIDECSASLAHHASQGFIENLEAIISRMGSLPFNIEMIYGVLTVLQKELLSIFRTDPSRVRIMNLIQQAQTVSSDLIQSYLVRKKNQATYLDSMLHEINQELATALSVQDLADVLWQNLPRLGIPACYISLYEEANAFSGFSRLILAYSKKGRIRLDDAGFRFPSKHLIPRGMRRMDYPAALVVLPLFYQEEQLGFVVFETGPRYGGLYEALREQISSALKRIRLHQKMLEARRVAEEADRLKSRFLSLVTHELRTPLSMIVSLSEMLLEDPLGNKPPVPEEYREDLEVIHSTGQHLDRLVLDVLDLGRSQLGQLKINLKMVDLGDLLREVEQMGEMMARDKDLSWRAQIPSDIPPIKGDRTRLRQILLNLISNATKFTLYGEVSLLVTCGDREVTIAVSDTGLGIPLEDQKNIFDEFHQSERTAARGYGGMGLGLAITRKLVELHGGKINLISTGKEGSGTTFYFTLPVQLCDNPIEEANEAEEIVTDSCVLVISPSQRSAQQLVDYLDRQGYRVNVAIGPDSQWLDRALQNPCSAIVITCDFESDWGWEVMQRLKSQPDKQDLPILFYTLMDESDRGAFLDLNMMAKPFKADLVLHMIHQQGIFSGGDHNKIQTVLVVDDEVEFLRLHTQIIHDHLPNCRVMEAKNGQMALDVMHRIQPDLVLLDLMMPEMDGFGVLEAMQAQHSLRSIPVIVMTGQVLTEEMMLRLNRCVAGILNKGVFSVEETLNKIEHSLSRDKRLGSEPQRIARRTMVFIHKNYAEAVSRTDIAKSIGVNERYLTHCFRQEVGVTPMGYLNRYRVKVAVDLLDAGKKSITEIGLEVGFSSSAHFSRVFSQHMGVSPREYLRKK